MERYAYNAPDEFRPKRSPDLYKIASRGFMGLTAYVVGRPHLVTAFDGQEYTLEDTEGETIQLQSFAWDQENTSEENALVAASRIEGSPFEAGNTVDGQVIGKLSFEDETGEWVVLDDAGSEMPLLDLIAELEAQGWQVEEEVELSSEEPILKTIDRAASAMCSDCSDEDCDTSSCQCPCHDRKEALRSDPKNLDIGEEEDEDYTYEPMEPMVPREDPVPDYIPEETPEEVPAGKFKANCENCGHELGDHTIDGHRCPSGKPMKAEEKPEPVAAHTVSSFEKTTDTNGEPLRAGDFYDLHSKKYRIPDMIKIIQITSDALIATTHEGSVTLTIKPLDIESEGYSFEPLFPSDYSEKKIESHFIETIDPTEGLGKTARRRFSPKEQNDLIEEGGEARNRHKLNLADSHYTESSNEEHDGDDLDYLFF